MKATTVVKFKGGASGTIYWLGGTYSLALKVGNRRVATLLFDRKGTFTGKGHLYLRKGEKS